MTVKKANHRYGSVATWSHCTDTLSTASNSMNKAEIAAFKFNLMMTVFASPWGENTTDIQKKQMYDGGRAKFQIYFQTDRWRDYRIPDTETDIYIKFPLIPDYNSTTWTQAAVDAGLNVTIGATKPTRYPNHGQELFDLSGGKYGYDVINGVAGEIDTLTPLIQAHKQWIKDTFGYYPSAASYRQGQLGSSYAMKNHFLGVRNSARDGRTTYGKNETQFLGTPQNDMLPTYLESFPITTRIGDNTALTLEESIAQADGYLQEAIASNGWFADFVHWHTSPDGELYSFFESQRNVMNTSDVATLDFGQALEHKTLRDIATVAETVNGSALDIQVDYSASQGLPLDTITIPLSVELDTTGTLLEGKEVQATGAQGIRKLSMNKFVIDVPFDVNIPSVTVNVSETLTPSYLDFELPIVESALIENNVMTVVTNKPTKLTLFKNTKGAVLDLAKVMTRSTTFKTTHVLDFNDETVRNYAGVTEISELYSSDIYIGAISETDQSVLFKTYELPELGYIRLKDVSGIITFPIYSNEMSNVKIQTLNGKGHLKLVDVTDVNASNRRVSTPTGVKAIAEV